MGYDGTKRRARLRQWGQIFAKLAVLGAVLTARFLIDGWSQQTLAAGVLFTLAMGLGAWGAFRAAGGRKRPPLFKKQAREQGRGEEDAFSLLDLVEESLAPEQTPREQTVQRCPHCRCVLTEGLPFCISCSRSLPDREERL